MKLVRYGPAGHEKPGAIDGEGRVRDLSAHVADLDAAALAPAAVARLAALDPAALPLVDGNPRLGVPVAGIGNLVCVGLNYRDHAIEAGMEIPNEPVLFMKSTNSLNGPHDPVVLPRGGEKGDWEVELAKVIGTAARCVSEEEALGHVAGYGICNDVSERSFQLERGGQWVKGKSCDTFAPLGPWLVTTDEVPDPQSLGLWLDVSGERMQHGTTANMIFGVAYLVSYISRFMTLAPGDVVSTGTPPGVGLGRKPPRYLRPGDVMALGIDGLGVQRQEVVASE